jgi:hypothetical protein
MIGVDHRHQGTRCGVGLLEAITGLARKLSQDIAVRFLLADANVRKVEWYEARGFVANRAERERDRTDPERSVSMRLDLLDEIRGSGSGGAQVPTRCSRVRGGSCSSGSRETSTSPDASSSAGTTSSFA